MTTRDRDKDFPATSIGRTAGARLPSTVQESHPLGVGTPLSEPSSSTTAGAGFTQKYKPYTPRTRGAPSPSVGPLQTTVPPTVTPGTLIHPPSPQIASGDDATTKLQLTNAKAEAQNVGLDTQTGGIEGPSMGWAMLEKIVYESETGELWTEIWNAITTGKATMLLPVEAMSSADRLTPEFFKDHIAYCDSTSQALLGAQATPIVTLSGLRGSIYHNTITFTSTLHSSSPLFQSLRDPNIRPTSLRKLPPLASETPPKGFPCCTVVTHHSVLPLPPKTQTSKPPLPPRPGVRPLSGTNTASPHVSSAPSSNSRILNPFASLFGHRPSTPTPSPIITASPPASIRSLESPSLNTINPHAVVEVEVIVVETKVSRKNVGKEMNSKLRQEIRKSLGSAHNTAVPEWVTDRVLEFCEPWFPFVRAPKTISSAKPVGGSEKAGKESEEWVVNEIEVDQPEDAVDFIQEFYAQLEDYLRVELDGGAESLSQEGKVDVEFEAKIHNIMTVVENTICSLFYDRLFMQPQTDDSSHDLTLSNRIAALNLLDLTLEHLDIAAEDTSKTEVESVVKMCGKKLCELDKVRIPKQKARILVDAHQVIVDGLSRLPPVRLMSPEESKVLKERQLDLLKDKTRITSTSDGSAVAPMSRSAVNEVTVVVSEVPHTSTTLAKTEENMMTPEPELSPLLLRTASELPSISTSTSSTPISSVPPSPHSDFDPTTTSFETASSETKPHKPTPVSSDVLLPMLIFSVVKSNPPHLVSNLLYLQRFRRRNGYSGEGDGEESFCLINMLAVAEFLENVDLEALGLSARSDVDVTDLSPILPRSPKTPRALTPKSSSGTLSGIEGMQLPGSLKGKVEQQVDAIAGSANKVISGVVDSSFGILRSFLPQNAPAQNGPIADLVVSVGAEDGETTESPTTAKPGQGFGLLRRDTGFSIASIAASLPVPGISSSSRSKGQNGEEGQQLVTVTSRPGSIKSARSAKGGAMGSDEEGDEDDEIQSEDEGSNDEDDEDEESGSGASEEDYNDPDDHRSSGIDVPGTHPYASSSSSIARNASASAGSFGADTKSIRSFESMMSDSKKRKKEKRLKALAKATEKERKKEERKANARMKEGKNVSVSASHASSVPRKSLTDRLASVGALASGVKDSPPNSRRSSLLHPPPIVAPVPPLVAEIRQLPSEHTRRGVSPLGSRTPSPSLPPSRSSSPFPTRTTLLSPAGSHSTSTSLMPLADSDARAPSATPASGSSLKSSKLLAPPQQKFLECKVDELSIREVGELLEEYRRLVAGVRQLGGFAE